MLTNKFRKSLKNIFGLAIICLILSDLSAQDMSEVVIDGKTFISTDPKVMAKLHLEQLKEGCLLVRLQSDKRKIEKLNALIDNAKDEKSKARYEDYLDEILEDQKEQETEMIGAVREYYDWSEQVYFFYDFNTNDVVNNKGSVMNYSKELIEMKDLSCAHAYILSSEIDMDSGVDIIRILDANLNELASPFPDPISITGLQRIFIGFNSLNIYENRIRKLNRHLFKAYSNVM